MKKFCILLLLGMIGAAQAVLVDDFSGDLSGWTSTVILDNQNPGTQNTASWQITDGKLQLNTTWRDGSSVEQYAMIKSGIRLEMGEELQADFSHTGASQDIGLYVGGTIPSFNIRRDYIAVYARNTGELFSRGFDGTTEYSQVGWIKPAYTKLFIARTGVNTFEVGYYDANGRNVMVTRTPTFANEADVIGIYADVRGIGVLGNVDNLRIVPEPATLTLLGLGGLLFVGKRK